MWIQVKDHSNKHFPAQPHPYSPSLPPSVDGNALSEKLSHLTLNIFNYLPWNSEALRIKAKANTLKQLFVCSADDAAILVRWVHTSTGFEWEDRGESGEVAALNGFLFPRAGQGG